MALTLEAALVIPLTMAITAGILSFSIQLYEQTADNACMEAQSFLYSSTNKSLWSCVVNEHSAYRNRNSSKDYFNNNRNKNNISWSKMIAVNPVKERNILTLLMDTASGVKEIIPVFNEMEGLFISNEKQ